MKKTFFVLSVLLVSATPLLVSASTEKITAQKIATTTPIKSEEVISCENKATKKKDSAIAFGLKDYTNKSKEITENAKNRYEKASWLLNSSYRIQSKKIQDEKKQALIPVTEKMNWVRLSANQTYKAEMALCDLLAKKDVKTATTTKK